ncbi:MAG: hypothetical protein UV73_C0008G0044 [Candidatus Gottesmanbacteria bacterium GW2011_GWA2_43_14]|uniref:CMP/dCMP-type deaminase domain-containing protein n=1 Tax=Candidatus Gottesmanbacteria bacterium GW2011_GWA2_43_14 TaxID=1618443 RepID=A0A0G1DIK0_9BACT|nr:MAG: hypothetical protein UV73_C0008G0044 [Candidatus Gottesmanbacteria bacterium GW2011_GWA2_43_14]
MTKTFEARSGLPITTTADNALTAATDQFMEQYPFLDPKQLEAVLKMYNGLFQSVSSSITDLPKNLFSEASPGNTLFLKDRNLGILDLYHNILASLRLETQSVFDMPTPRVFQEIDGKLVIQNSRRVYFNRLVCRPYPADSNAPFIIARWNMNSGEPMYVQAGIALDRRKGPEYLKRTVISEKGDLRVPVPPDEAANPAHDQENEYWKLILYAAQKSLDEGRYPYAALIEPTGRLGPVIISRNKNRAQGEGFDGHAEHMALTAMNGMGYKQIEMKKITFEPVVYSLFEPCHSCSQMIREQGRNKRGVVEVKYILEQPAGWGGRKVLRSQKLTESCGKPPAITRVAEFKTQALELFRQANQYPRGQFAGEFNKTIAVNE